MTPSSGGPQWDPKSKRWILPADEPARPAERASRTDATRDRAPSRPATRPENAAAPSRAATRPAGRRAPAAPPRGGTRTAPRTPARPPRARRQWPVYVGAAAAVLVVLGGILFGTGMLSGTGLPGTSDSRDAPVALPAPPPAPVFADAADAQAAASALGGGAAPAPSGTDVVFEVTGTGPSSSISYSGPGGVATTSENDPLPWTRTVPAAGGELDTYLLTVQGGQNPAEITCRITLNGRAIAESSSSGQFSVASCNGTSSPYG